MFLPTMDGPGFHFGVYKKLKKKFGSDAIKIVDKNW